MKINVLAKGFELSPGTHEGIEQELTDLSKILKVTDPSYRVTIKKRVYGEYECMISTYMHSRNYNVKATRKSIRASIEAAAKALKEMALEDHAKHIDKRINSARDVQDTVKDSTVGKQKVTKQKDVHLTPISDEDAIIQLNESEHDMFMYLDESTLEVKGVYHRADGYGVITFKTV